MNLPRRIGKYEIRGVLGRGGSGVVYRAWQADLGREVAVKALIAGEHGGPDLLKRFLREARAAAALGHPGVVQVHELGEDGGVPYIAMELLPGGSVADLLRKRRLAPAEALRIAERVAEALEAAHARGFVHRDVKPSNLLLDAEGRPKLADFGLARDVEDRERLTATGDLVGTAWYMSPEQAFGAPEEVDARSDVYSLGAVLYEMLTGRPPFDGARAAVVLKKIESETPKAPSAVDPAIDPRLDAPVLRALEKDPSRRFASAAEFRAALRDAAGRAASGRPAKSRRPFALGALAGAVGAAALALLALPRTPDAPAPPAPPPPAPAPRDPAAPAWKLFVRYGIDHRAAGPAVLRARSATGLEEELDRLRAAKAAPEQLAWVEAALLCLKGEHADAAERTAGRRDERGRLVRAAALVFGAAGEEGEERRRAMEALARTELADASSPDALFLAAWMEAAAGRDARALELAARLSQAEAPGRAAAHVRRAAILDRMGRKEPALENLELACRLDPSDLLAFCYRAALKLERWGNDRLDAAGFVRETRAVLGAASERPLPFPGPAFFAGVAELVDGKLPAAEELHRRTRLRFGSPTTWKDLADPGEFEELLAAAGQPAPKYAWAAARLLSRLRLPGAEPLWRDVASRIAAAPGLGADERRGALVDAHRELAFAELKAGRRDAAVEHLLTAVRAGGEFDEIVDDDARFEALRSDPRFRELRGKR